MAASSTVLVSTRGNGGPYPYLARRRFFSKPPHHPKLPAPSLLLSSSLQTRSRAATLPMYVTPPDTDIYSIPRVLAPMPQKYVRCTKKNFGRYHVSEPPVEHLRDPMYKTEREIMKVTVPEGKKRDRRNDLLLIRDGGESFRITDKTKRDDATTVIQREEWAKSRQDVEKHFRKLRDFDYSNWF
ncbi:hypothetical protein PR202_ga24984 [Eleusine coracana subsp. coracana]|uniref:Uncharacterized protein n=1 Tax=Eleusine coracana subsp. coracana TaxID=191504 RepID=A0AAV5D936_ELECO|nr:hypothetical protein PR202_ga24984 [Eleusine coracana subsp. coracana]